MVAGDVEGKTTINQTSFKLCGDVESVALFFALLADMEAGLHGSALIASQE